MTSHENDLHGPTLSRTITCLSFLRGKLALVQAALFYSTLSLNWLYAPSTNRSQKKKTSEQARILY